MSVFTIIANGQQILLLQRANTEWLDGFYSLPAGAIDGGKPLDVAAAREANEETGITIAPENLELVHTIHCKNGDSQDEWLGVFFVTRSWTGDPKIAEPHKHSQLGWFSKLALPKDLIPYTKQGLEGYFKKSYFRFMPGRSYFPPESRIFRQK